MDAMQNNFMESFDTVLEKAKLYNLELGNPVPDNVKESQCLVRELQGKYEMLNSDWRKVTIKHFVTVLPETNTLLLKQQNWT